MPSDAHRINVRLAREYLAWQRDTRNRSPETLVAYTATLEKLLAWVDDTPFAAASVARLEGFVNRPRQRRDRGHPVEGPATGAPATRARDVTVIRSFYKYLQDRGHIGHNPAALLTAPKITNTHPKAIPDDMWRAVWAHPSLDDTERVVLGLGYFCGLRRAEIVNLRPGHVDLDSGRLIDFPRKGALRDVMPLRSPVTLMAERLPQVVPGGPESFLEPLRRERAARDDAPYFLAWGEELGGEEIPNLKGKTRLEPYPDGWTPPYIVNRRLRGILRRNSLPAGAFTPHQLRHSFVTNLLRAGVPLHVASRMAAHGDIATTMRYVSTSIDPLADLIGVSEHLPRVQRWPAS
ncbi:MAG: tyrosine-type recombinase/integrase [Acidimicrobiales bacterium]